MELVQHLAKLFAEVDPGVDSHRSQRQQTHFIKTVPAMCTAETEALSQNRRGAGRGGKERNK